MSQVVCVMIDMGKCRLSKVLFALPVCFMLLLCWKLPIFVSDSSMSARKLQLRREFKESYQTMQTACQDPKIQQLVDEEVPHFRFAFDPKVMNFYL